MLNLFRKKKAAAPVPKGEDDEEEETPTEEMKRAQVDQRARDEEAVKRQRLGQLAQLVVQYSDRILKESDETRKAGLKGELAAVQVQIAQEEVRIAQEGEDAQKQFDAQLALFKAEKGLMEAKLAEAEAKAEAKAAAATSDALRDTWNKKLVAALADSEAFQTALPAELEAKTKELRARFFPVEKLLTSIEFDEFEDWLTNRPLQPQVSAYHGAAHSEMQRALLGPFHKEGEQGMWPITGGAGQWKLDLELLPSLLGDNELRPAARDLLDVLKKDPRYILMLAVSGGGKTSAFADIAHQHYVMYIQCTPWDSKEDARKSRGYDHGFIAMLRRLHHAITTDTTKNASEGERLFALELVCRLAQLYRLVKAKPDLTSFEYYVHQKNAGDSWLEVVRDRFAHLTLGVLKRLASSMYDSVVNHLGKSRLVIAVDEIEAAAKELEDYFDENKEKKKGFLSPMISAFTSLQTNVAFKVIFTGTASGLERMETIKSSLNKTEELSMMESIPKSFPTVTLTACRKFFSKLNLDDQDLKWDEITGTQQFDRARTVQKLERESLEMILDYFVIGSRFRTLIRVVLNITGSKDYDEAEMTKRGALKLAVVKSLVTFQDDIRRHFRKTAESRDIHQAVKDMYMDYFTTIWTNMCLTGGRALILKSKAEKDLMMLGIGNFEAHPTSKDDGYFIVTEYLVADSIRVYLAGVSEKIPDAAFRRALDAFERLVRVHGAVAARGTILEEMVFQSLCRPEFQGKMVSELPFVEPFAAKNRSQKVAFNQAIQDAQNDVRRTTRSASALAEQPVVELDSWWTQTAFRATETMYAHQLPPGMTTSAYLASDEALAKVYSPETVARPDGVLMLDKHSAIVLGITIWNGSVPSDKVLSQLRSTDLSLAYFTANGQRVNPNCERQRTDWEAHGLHRIRAVRVHVALPIASCDDVNERPDELLVHLDQTNCHLLFGKDDALYDVLAIATKTERKVWNG